MLEKNSLRSQIREEIAAIEPLDSSERQDIESIVQWIDSGAELFRRTKPATPPKHLISYFVLVDGEYVLLVAHKNSGRWLPTGGHVDPNEHPVSTVKREAREELGVAAQFLIERPIIASTISTVGLTAGHTDVCLWYALKAKRSDTFVFDQTEFTEVRWFHITEAPLSKSDPYLERFLKKLALLG